MQHLIKKCQHRMQFCKKNTLEPQSMQRKSLKDSGSDNTKRDVQIVHCEIELFYSILLHDKCCNLNLSLSTFFTLVKYTPIVIASKTFKVN